MATNKPESRKTHVTRIFGTNRNGDILPDIYVDVERMDIVKSAHQVPPSLQWQGLQRQFRWCDDPNADDYNEDGTPSRILEIVKVCDVETQDPDDPDEWVPVQSIKGLKARVETGTDTNGGGGMLRFLAGVTQQELKTARKIEVRKISHFDTNIDDDARAAADSGLKHYVVPSEQYEKVEGSKDDTQFVDHEIILYLKGNGNHDEVNQNSQTKLLNQYLIDESDGPDGEITGSAGYNPPYRLDPFQNIINVQFNPVDQQWLLAVSNWSRPDANNHDNASLHADVEAADGGAWSDALGGASGAGITVICGAVAYGAITLKDGAKQSCFLACSTQMREAKLGTISDGSVSWETVWSAKGDEVLNFITAISYANDRFFITFMAGEISSRCNVISTKDGKTFSAKHAPFPSRGNSIGPFGGAVAYDKKLELYVMVGDDFVDDDETGFGLASSDGFCWATSADGITWIGGQIDGVFKNPGGGGHFAGNVDGTSLSTVAAGNGVFVGAATQRHEVMQTVTIRDDLGEFHEEQAPYIIPSCAVALSTNGTSWMTIPLPGAVWRQNLEGGDIGGTTVSVVFIEDKDYRDDKGNTGYFVACGYEGSAPGFENAKLWKSVDGSAWSMIRSETHDVFTPGQYVGLSAINKKVKTVVTL